jgi:transcriptional regulator with XRE-family HTH domain
LSAIGELIKTLREQKGFSQRQLAYLAKINNTEVSRIEKGERKNPNPKALKKIARALGVDYLLLFKTCGYIDNPQNVIETKDPESQEDVDIEVWIKKGLSPEEINEALEIYLRYKKPLS